MWTTDKKCPRCGSRSFQIADYCKISYIYECIDGIVEADGQGDSCDHISTTCICRQCGHEWHPKGKVLKTDNEDLI